MQYRLLAGFCLALGAWTTTAAQAANDPQVVITSGTQADGYSAPFSDQLWETVGFRMGSTSLYLYDVTLRLQASSAGVATLALFSANPNAPYSTPLTQIGNFTSVLVSGRDNYTFRPTSTMALEAGELYWLVMRGAEAAGLRYVEAIGAISGDYGSPYTSELGARAHDFANSSDGGLNWMVHSGLNAIEVRGAVSPVPEPGTYALMLLGGGLLLLSVRQDRHRG
ncbi:PEP-CTERM sorting domain-containing protein [Aquincola tertiaricarbonis]|uniref:PEP-CTERM sorting domain-containing protein n=1 Tax=Aquincola tertiaricarbonis TaxID=391953 RepID=A0ABY4SGH0_AQUTE|nr:choice-of-anchor R domain-containing protein [Aquincola tertiaricarbonis]URI11604.1 PEP-CTERM sorting domain-containing protein [Aquincola tertiaricarbonis]